METSCQEKLASGVCVTHVAAEAAAPQKATISVSVAAALYAGEVLFL
jgi:hypothetical protein